MNRVVRLSAALYRILVRFYPADLRHRWEPEMADTFALQIRSAASEGGWIALIETWSCALAELLRIALPLQLTRTCVVVPAVSLAGASAVFFSLVWALENSLVMRAALRHLVTKLGG